MWIKRFIWPCSNIAQLNTMHSRRNPNVLLINILKLEQACQFSPGGSSFLVHAQFRYHKRAPSNASRPASYHFLHSEIYTYLRTALQNLFEHLDALSASSWVYCAAPARVTASRCLRRLYFLDMFKVCVYIWLLWILRRIMAVATTETMPQRPVTPTRRPVDAQSALDAYFRAAKEGIRPYEHLSMIETVLF